MTRRYVPTLLTMYIVKHPRYVGEIIVNENGEEVKKPVFTASHQIRSVHNLQVLSDRLKAYRQCVREKMEGIKKESEGKKLPYGEVLQQFYNATQKCKEEIKNEEKMREYASRYYPNPKPIMTVL